MFVRIGSWTLVNMDKVSMVCKPRKDDAWSVILDSGQVMEIAEGFEDYFFSALESGIGGQKWQ